MTTVPPLKGPAKGGSNVGGDNGPSDTFRIVGGFLSGMAQGSIELLRQQLRGEGSRQNVASPLTRMIRKSKYQKGFIPQNIFGISVYGIIRRVLVAPSNSRAIYNFSSVG